MEPYFELEGVSVVREQADGTARGVLHGIDWKVVPGERYAVVGRSGAGKSTLLRLLNRLEEPAEGRILRKGVPLTEILPAVLRREVALVPQEPIWLPGSAEDNLLTAARLGVVPMAEARARLRETAERVGVDPEHLGRGEDELSVGQRQRVVLGRALLAQPEVLLLDEPTSALDPPGARALLQRVIRLADATRLTTIMVTHRLSDARQLGTRTLVLDEGRAVDSGPTPEVLSRLERRWDESPDRS